MATTESLSATEYVDNRVLFPILTVIFWEFRNACLSGANFLAHSPICSVQYPPHDQHHVAPRSTIIMKPSFISPKATMRRRQDNATQSRYITKFRPGPEQPGPAVATPSPILRETLRKACLDRARRKRRDLVSRKRLEHSNGEANNDESKLGSEFREDDSRPTRMVVEEELRKYGVGVQSRCFDGELSSTPGRTRLFECYTEGSNDHHMETAERPSNEKIEEEKPLDFYISEDELFEILEEVEDELARLDGTFMAALTLCIPFCTHFRGHILQTCNLL